jgi:hypothetical protein
MYLSTMHPCNSIIEPSFYREIHACNRRKYLPLVLIPAEHTPNQLLKAGAVTQI